MKITDDKIREINEQNNGNFRNKLSLRLTSGLDSTIVVKNNWEICKVNELTDLIEGLIELRSTIANETGIIF